MCVCGTMHAACRKVSVPRTLRAASCTLHIVCLYVVAIVHGEASRVVAAAAAAAETDWPGL